MAAAFGGGHDKGLVLVAPCVLPLVHASSLLRLCRVSRRLRQLVDSAAVWAGRTVEVTVYHDTVWRPTFAVSSEDLRRAQRGNYEPPSPDILLTGDVAGAGAALGRSVVRHAEGLALHLVSRYGASSHAAHDLPSHWECVIQALATRLRNPIVCLDLVRCVPPVDVRAVLPTATVPSWHTLLVRCPTSMHATEDPWMEGLTDCLQSGLSRSLRSLSLAREDRRPPAAADMQHLASLLPGLLELELDCSEFPQSLQRAVKQGFPQLRALAVRIMGAREPYALQDLLGSLFDIARQSGSPWPVQCLELWCPCPVYRTPAQLQEEMAQEVARSRSQAPSAAYGLAHAFPQLQLLSLVSDDLPAASHVLAAVMQVGRPPHLREVALTPAAYTHSSGSDEGGESVRHRLDTTLLLTLSSVQMVMAAHAPVQVRVVVQCRSQRPGATFRPPSAAEACIDSRTADALRAALSPLARMRVIVSCYGPAERAYSGWFSYG